MIKILFFMSIHRIGITSQLYYHAKSVKENPDIELLGVGGEGEQYQGIRNQVTEEGIKLTIIKGLDRHSDFKGLVDSLHELIIEFEPDVIHVRTNWQLALATTVKKLYSGKFRIMSTIHGYRHNHPRKAVIAKFLIGLSLRMFADKVITPSSFLKDEFSLVGNKRVVLPIGVDDEFFTIGNTRVSFSEEKRIMFAGEFRQGKNQDLLIRALHRYIKDTGDENVHMMLPGKGPKQKECQTLAVQLGIGEKVGFPGFLARKEMLACYLNSQFVIVPSNSETFGHCITEPFVLGRVLITRPVGVAMDIIQNEKTGFFFDDENELVTVLKKVLLDNKLCSQISENALSKRDYLRWSNVGSEYVKLLEEMVGSR